MDKKNVLYAGYARADITPDFSVGLCGYCDPEDRLSEGVRDPIYLTCIAVTSGAETILMFDADLLNITDWGAQMICDVVCPATGIPADKIFCGATHSHSGPLFYDDRYGEQYDAREDVIRFRKILLEAAVQIAKQALSDRAPAQMFTGTKVIKGMNFVRHYLMEDGTYTGSNFGNYNIRFVAHAGESDPRLLLLKFAREEKPDIIMMNWQAHNDNAYSVGFYNISSSYVGQIRAHFEEKTGMHFAFFQGASGNQNPSSRIEEEKDSLTYVEYGKKLADYAIETMQNMKTVVGTDIVTRRLVFAAPVDHSWDHMLAEAKQVYDLYKTVGKKEADDLGKTYGFSSAYHGEAILDRAGRAPTTEVVLNAFRIGDLGFVTSPNELFSTIGLHVRLHGPFESTFIITGNCRYMPCMAAYEYRSYEADTGLFAKGTAEKVADTFVEMLEKIYYNKETNY